MQIFDFLCGIDSATGIIVYRWPNWPGTPKLISTDVNIQFFYFRGNSEEHIKENDFISFSVIRKKERGTASLILRTVELLPEKQEQLTLMQLKCRCISAWLNKIHLKISAADGILPGIYGVKPSGADEHLFIENHKKIKAIAAEIIYEFHDRMWLAKTEDEFLDVYNAAIARWVI